ncbi:MAG: Sua5/YciO/YrdC/YwlC family protein [Xanthomonadaceae bacterium]|nr:Sua5/YciO/YrdC/YwlC family protein [Xanthomonadaceae bacterium]
MTPLLSHAQAADVARHGGVIAYPTEGVWGLGCNPLDEAAVTRLLTLKQRDIVKGLILIAAREAQLEDFIDYPALPRERLAAVRATWPGPSTWVMPASIYAPAWITGAHRGIAVRVSAHPDVVALCEDFGGALVSTSANLAGQPAPSRREDLDPALLAAIDGVCEGGTGGRSGPSVIRDARTGDILRA